MTTVHILSDIDQTYKRKDYLIQLISLLNQKPQQPQICAHNYKGKKCTKIAIDNSPFCEKHKCKTKGCKKHRIGWEFYKGVVDEYGIYNPPYKQLVLYCEEHRCDYVSGMGNPLGIHCNKEKGHFGH